MTTPKLRFKGFNDKWLSNRLSDIGVLKSGYGFPTKEQGGNAGIPFFKVSDIANSIVEMKTSNNYVSEKQIDMNKWKVINPSNGSIIFAKVGAALLKNRKRLVKTPFLIDNNIMSYSLSKSWNYQFGIYKLTNVFFPKYAQVGALPSLNSSDIGNINVKIPKIEEQSKVGLFFTKIDELIKKQNKKMESIITIKNGYLQNLFTDYNENKPNLRFKEFIDSWQKKQLVDVSTILEGNDNTNDLPVLTISASKGFLTQKDRFSKVIAGNELKNYTLLKSGDLSYNHGNSKIAKYGAVFELTDYDKALVPKVYHSFRTNEFADPKFIEELFKSKIPDRELRKLVSSGARMDGLLNISKTAFFGINIKVPSLNEQIKISKLLNLFDKQIELQQKNLDKLQILKKGYLQKMFI